ncbi:Phage head-tail adaptor [Actibacterium atlanticum]|uniref:Phage head-tail adaptor n=1 Tax=Actibacterium atlanticum TaxID=1461693 RepID=A0A058ZQQ4_9RHOB|nr:head-tail adaptor protein [Actibacterium atlanticum]KCV83502.1 Phage head-tail adaptor [Actibacterium atlanticum]
MSAVPRLTRRLVLEEAQNVADGAGGYDTSWVALGTLYAQVKPGSGRETTGETVPLSRVPYRITVRGAPVGASYRPQAGQRFREGSRLFEILAVTEQDARGQYLTCFAQEEGAA